MTYTQNIPDGPNNPSQDQPLMKANTNAIFSLIGTDHINFNLPNSGYHNIIHQPPQGSDPVSIAGINQVYAKNVTPNSTVTSTDTQLFTETGAGIISQLTGNLLGLEGYAWVGGILLQWGQSSSTSTTITFKDRVAGAIPFPTQCFSVYTSLRSIVSIPVPAASIGIVSKSTTQFKTQAQGDLSTISGFFWLAIGY